MVEQAAPARERRENSLLALIRIPVFRRMWAAIAFSSLGDWLGLLANTALAQQLTKEQSVATQGVAISGVILVRLAPDLLFGPIAAAIADKLDRRKTVIVGELTAGVLYASIAIGYNLIWLYVAQFAIEAAGLFTQPAKQVIWVAIVPKELLATANQVSLMSVYGTVPVASGVFALLSSITRVIGGPQAMLPGRMNTAIVVALLLNTLTFFVSAMTVFLSRRQIPVVPRAREQGQGIVSLLREGVAFVRRNSLIRGLYVGIIGAFAAGGLTVGVAQLWVATLSAGAAGYSIMFGTVFTGLAIGMLVGPRVLPSYARSRVFGLAIGGVGVTLIIMSVVRDFILATGLAALVGTFSGMAWIIGYTMIGYEVDDRLRGRIFAFVLSSVRIMLLLTIAVGPVVAGLLGSHAIPVGNNAHLSLSGPGLTLLIGGILALGVSYYATSRATRSSLRLRDVLRGRVIRSGYARRTDHRGLLLTVDGVDPDATAGYSALLVDAARARGLTVVPTAEPTDSAIGRHVAQVLRAAAADGGIEPETAALLAAADRAEHVAATIRPCLERGAVVVCDRYTLTSLAVYAAASDGPDVTRVRSINAWSAGGLLPDLCLVVDLSAVDLAVDDDASTIARTLRDEAGGDPDRYLLCTEPPPDALPAAVLDRLSRLFDARAPLLTETDHPAPERSDAKLSPRDSVQK